MNKKIAIAIVLGVVCVGSFLFFNKIKKPLGYVLGESAHYVAYIPSQDLVGSGEKTQLTIVDKKSNKKIELPIDDVTGIEMEDSVNDVKVALSFGTSPIRHVMVVDFLSGKELYDVCHVGRFILTATYLLYTDCTRSPELEEKISDATQSNVIQKFFDSAPDRVLRQATTLENYTITSINMDDNKNPIELQLDKTVFTLQNEGIQEKKTGEVLSL